MVSNIKIFNKKEIEIFEKDEEFEEIGSFMRKIMMKIPFAAIVVFYLIVATINGKNILLYMILYLIPPSLYFLFFDYFGKAQGYGIFMGSGSNITAPNPPFLVKAGAWMILLLPVAVYFILTGGKISIFI